MVTIAVSESVVHVHARTALATFAADVAVAASGGTTRAAAGPGGVDLAEGAFDRTR